MSLLKEIKMNLESLNQTIEEKDRKYKLDTLRSLSERFSDLHDIGLNVKIVTETIDKNPLLVISPDSNYEQNVSFVIAALAETEQCFIISPFQYWQSTLTTISRDAEFYGVYGASDISNLEKKLGASIAEYLKIQNKLETDQKT